VVIFVGIGLGRLVIVSHVGVLHETGLIDAEFLLPILKATVIIADFFLLFLDSALLLQPFLLLLPTMLLRLSV
jgi:hypothetical protein